MGKYGPLRVTTKTTDFAVLLSAQAKKYGRSGPCRASLYCCQPWLSPIAQHILPCRSTVLGEGRKGKERWNGMVPHLWSCFCQSMAPSPLPLPNYAYFLTTHAAVCHITTSYAAPTQPHVAAPPPLYATLPLSASTMLPP